MSHKFKVGDIVTVRPAIGRFVPNDVFEVLKRLPGSNEPEYQIKSAMARSYLIFGHIEGKLDVLRVECGRCQRKGRHSVRRLIEKYGRNANMMKWKEQLNGHCPK